MAEKIESFAVSEWEWLKLQLRVYSLENRAEIYGEYYDFDENGKVICNIFGKQVQGMVDNKANQTEQLEYYRGWVQGVKRNLEKILSRLSGLSKSFDMKSDLVVRIRYSYGMGASLVCELVGDSVKWAKSNESK